MRPIQPKRTLDLVIAGLAYRLYPRLRRVRPVNSPLPRRRHTSSTSNETAILTEMRRRGSLAYLTRRLVVPAREDKEPHYDVKLR